MKSSSTPKEVILATQKLLDSIEPLVKQDIIKFQQKIEEI